MLPRPEARRVGGEHLVDQEQFALGRDPELELGVGQDDSSLRGGRRPAALVDVDRPCSRSLLREFGSHDPGRSAASRVMFSSWPSVRLRRRREDGRDEGVALDQPLLERLSPASVPGFTVLLPRGPGQVAAHHALDRNAAGSGGPALARPAQQRPRIRPARAAAARISPVPHRDEVVRACRARYVSQPPRGDLGEDARPCPARARP